MRYQLYLSYVSHILGTPRYYNPSIYTLMMGYNGITYKYCMKDMKILGSIDPSNGEW